MNFCHVPALNFDDILDFKSPLNFPQHVKKLADKCFPEALDSKNKVKKVMQSEIVQLKTIEDNRDILYFKCNCGNDYRKCKFRTANMIYVEKNRTTRERKVQARKRNCISKKERFIQALQKGIHFYTIQHLFLIIACDILWMKKDIAINVSKSEKNSLDLHFSLFVNILTVNHLRSFHISFMFIENGASYFSLQFVCHFSTSVLQFYVNLFDLLCFSQYHKKHLCSLNRHFWVLNQLNFCI